MTKRRLGIVDQDNRDNLMNEDRALRSAAKMLDERLRGRRCDSPAVSSCERCNTAFLADRVLYAIKQDTDLEDRDDPPPPGPPSAW